MFITNYLDPLWFLISFCIGIFLVYCMTPSPEIIIKYPTPDNASSNIFEDDANNCYKFTTKEVSCSKAEKIEEIPISRKIEYFSNKKICKKIY